MIEFLNTDNYEITIDGKRWDLLNDFESLEEKDGRQKTYLRPQKKILVLKELKRDYPDTYQEVKKRIWFDKYKDQIEVGEEGGVMNTEILEKLMNGFENLSKSIDNISDEHKINFAKEDIKNFVNEFMKKEYPNLPKSIDVRVADDKVIRVEGHTHKIFGKVCKYVKMREHQFIWGPAGTGKNYLVKQVADAVDGKFFYASTVTQEFKLIGYKDANGEYQDTELRRALDYAIEHPETTVIFMLDELDACSPDAMVTMNALLANGYCDFPDKRIEVGSNFVVIAAGNTAGVGADMVYTGRNVVDGATLDRFTYVKMDYDKALEEAICPDEELRNFIYDIRKSVAKNHINMIVGMRSLKKAYKMLVNDIDKQDIVTDAIIKSLGEDDINVIKHDLDSSNEWYKYFKYVA